MTLTLAEAADRVKARLDALEVDPQGNFDEAIARAVELTAINGTSAAAVLGAASTELLRVLGLLAVWAGGLVALIGGAAVTGKAPYG